MTPEQTQTKLNQTTKKLNICRNTGLIWAFLYLKPPTCLFPFHSSMAFLQTSKINPSTNNSCRTTLNHEPQKQSPVSSALGGSRAWAVEAWLVVKQRFTAEIWWSSSAAVTEGETKPVWGKDRDEWWKDLRAGEGWFTQTHLHPPLVTENTTKAESALEDKCSRWRMIREACGFSHTKVRRTGCDFKVTAFKRPTCPENLDEGR